jgi:hypothetical protein
MHKLRLYDQFLRVQNLGSILVFLIHGSQGDSSIRMMMQILLVLSVNYEVEILLHR